MEDFSTRWKSERGAEGHDDDERAARFMLNVITATIFSSGDDYGNAVDDFFTQLEALGLLIGASDLDEVSAYMRRNCRSF